MDGATGQLPHYLTSHTTPAHVATPPAPLPPSRSFTLQNFVSKFFPDYASEDERGPKEFYVSFYHLQKVRSGEGPARDGDAPRWPPWASRQNAAGPFCRHPLCARPSRFAHAGPPGLPVRDPHSRSRSPSACASSRRSALASWFPSAAPVRASSLPPP